MNELLNKIQNENCLTTMRRMSPSIVDLTVTSPPYDEQRTYQGYDFDFELIAAELFRVTKPGGVLVWIATDSVKNNSHTLTHFKQALFFKELGFDLYQNMVYSKSAIRFKYPNRYANSWESMFVFSKGRPKSINLLRDRKNVTAGQATQVRYRKPTGEKQRELEYERKENSFRGNVWEYASGYGHTTKDKIAFEHPALLSEKIAEDHILSWSNEGDLIYDPFMGSGTVAKMAILHNRNYIGSEISDKYVRIAQQRLNDISCRMPLLINSKLECNV